MKSLARTAALAALLFSTLGTASAEQWNFIGGPDPLVRNIRAYGNSPAAGQTTLFMATLGAGVVRITDVGTGFQDMSQVNTGLPTKRIRSIAGPGSVPGILYVATEANGVYRTPDAGVSGWTSVNGSGPTALPCMNVRNLSVISATEVYALTACQYNGGVYRSTDSGATWSNIATSGIPGDAVPSAISFDITTAYVATLNYGILKGTLGGAFAQSNGTGANKIPDQGGTDRLSVFNVVVRSPTTTLLAFSPGQGVYRSLDAGANWTAVNNGLPSLFAHGGVGGDGLGNFYLSLDKDGTYVTSNNGDNWTLWGTSNSHFKAKWARGIVRDGLNGRIYMPTLSGFARTSDNGISFLDAGLPPTGAGTIAVLPGGRKAYATTEAPFLIRNLHEPFATCTLECPLEITNNLPGSTTDGQIQHFPDSTDKVLVTTAYRGLWMSSNAGGSWAQLPLPYNPTESIRFTIAWNNAQVILAGKTNPFRSATGGGIMRSLDGGATWSDLSAGLGNPDARSINRISVPQNGQPPYFAATEGGIYRNTDGTNWVLVYSALDGGGNLLGTNHLTGHPGNPQIVYAANDHTSPDGTILGSSGVLRTLDGGDNWSVVLPGRQARQVRAEGNGTAWGFLQRDLANSQVVRTTDNGNTWIPYSNGIPAGDARGAGALGAPSFKVVAINDSTGIYTETPKAKLLADFDASGSADITWRDPSGQAAMWLMNGTAITGSALLLGPATGWTVIENDGDYNGDGFKDLLWVNQDGRWAMWLMNGTNVVGSALIFGGGGGWQVTHIGDFNGDGRTDLVWRDATNQVALWLMDGVTPIGSALVFGPGTTWQVTKVEDFNGDGYADLLFKDAAGQLSMWLMNGTGVFASGIIYGGGAFVETSIGDFNGDGMADIVFKDAGNAVAIWLMNGLTPMASGVVYGGGAFQLTNVADFDGNGKSDLVFTDPGGQVSIWLIDGLAVANSAIIFGGGGGWNVVRASDFNGDGRADLMWVDGAGQVALWMMNGLVPAATGVIFGGNGGWVIQPN